ncbi:hypothetical protein [Falsiroseomonas sp. HW251]|uniref:hypothetical protein n=1 Tax=Falsiroseomonas sp. HW251 TaxID=3390998 RepID=UPI003D322D84
MPWGEGPGELPPMRRATGEALVQMAAQAAVHQVIGADDLEREATQDAWHTFADLMQDVADTAAMLDADDRAALAKHLDGAIADLRRVGARVVAGSAGDVLFVAVIPIGDRRDLRAMFAAG